MAAQNPENQNDEPQIPNKPLVDGANTIPTINEIDAPGETHQAHPLYRTMGIAAPPPQPMPPSPYALLGRVNVASPCGENWDAMPDGERVRSCAVCRHKVYNLSEMTAKEAAKHIEEAEGRLCVRFYRRPDGTVMTRDCPTGARFKRRRIARAGVIGGTALAAVMGVGISSRPRAEQPVFVRWVLDKVAPEPAPTVGAVAFHPLPMATPVPKVAPPPAVMGEMVIQPPVKQPTMGKVVEMGRIPRQPAKQKTSFDNAPDTQEVIEPADKSFLSGQNTTESTPRSDPFAPTR